MIQIRFGKEKRGPWTSATPVDLQRRAIPLLYLSLASVEAVHDLVVSPGSEASRKFVGELDILTRSLTSELPSVDAITEASTQILVSTKAYCEWQRAEVESLQLELMEASRGFADTLTSALGFQNEVIDDFHRVADDVGQLQECDDLEQVRRKVKQQFEAAKKAIEKHEQSRDVLKEEFNKAIQTLEERVKTVETVGGVDFLTNIPNRAALDVFLHSVCQRVATGDQKYSVAMFDLDDFKGINDRLGHSVGDEALKLLVKVASAELGEHTTIARYGGDEFVAVYKGEADALARRILKLIRVMNGTEFDVKSPEGMVTIAIRTSAGVTDVLPGDDPERLLWRADQALYAAKHAGKNTVRKAEKRDDAAA